MLLSSSLSCLSSTWQVITITMEGTSTERKLSDKDLHLTTNLKTQHIAMKEGNFLMSMWKESKEAIQGQEDTKVEGISTSMMVETMRVREETTKEKGAIMEEKKRTAITVKEATSIVKSTTSSINSTLSAYLTLESGLLWD